jgi:hypothetical protein
MKDNHVIYTCLACPHVVDFTNAREEYDRQHSEGAPADADSATQRAQYDPSAGEVATPDGPALFVAYDSRRGLVTVERDYRHLVGYPAAECFVIKSAPGIESLGDGRYVRKEAAVR